jgi:hypothetical protein
MESYFFIGFTGVEGVCVSKFVCSFLLFAFGLGTSKFEFEPTIKPGESLLFDVSEAGVETTVSEGLGVVCCVSKYKDQIFNKQTTKHKTNKHKQTHISNNISK